MNHRRSRSRAFAPDPDAPGRTCDMPGCCGMGDYRAPKSRTTLNDYWWFCLEHVRAYNASWDFYKGMSPGEIETQLRADTSWQRPTWPLGHIGGSAWEQDALHDPLHILSAGRVNRGLHPAGAHAAGGQRPDALPAELREPLATLGLDWPTTLDVVKSRYKELAKKHHPDANGGDRAAEERLKIINLAYAAVRTKLTAEPRLQATG